MTRKRHLRTWIQMLLEINLFICLGALCSINIIKVNIWSVLIMIALSAGLLISGMLLKKYGRYDHEL